MPYKVIRDFEKALCDYTGARYAVTTNSCTMALLLCCAYHKSLGAFAVSIPKRTYVSVPMSAKHAGLDVIFHDEDWHGAYQLHGIPVWDSARRFTSGMFGKYEMHNQMMCVSFHWNKILGIQQGGAILHDDAEADGWFRRARFDGRTEGIAPKDDTFDMLGWHCFMSPEIAAEGLVRLSFLPRNNDDLPNDDYPDLSAHEAFK